MKIMKYAEIYFNHSYYIYRKIARVECLVYKIRKTLMYIFSSQKTSILKV